MTSQSDAHERLQSVRNKKPFESLVHEHGAAVLRICAALLGPDEAEDAWSETFLSALRAYPDLDVEVNAEAWLVTIAKRRSLDFVRSAVRRPIPVGRLPDLIQEAAEIDAEFDLALLTVRQRTAVAQHYLDGMSYAEVAEHSGGTEAAARRAAADGIRALRAQVRENRQKGDSDAN
ncbi:RNA polymerase sigma factor [Smaragdicoccus niigatensis]|uniref:RNA polymerase sigma factor n=1 Tax=Smaragdicoccus niigatensis TaxID=359359 RepID=UPI00037980FF|nr:sigma-70 family RNA polymerase sigma factor [Smaragdicoccus niigatensis]